MNGIAMTWVEKVKYLGTYIWCKLGMSDISSNIRRFYSQFNNILSVLGKSTHKMATLHLTKSYCLSALLYGCETWFLTSFDLHKASVAWNNSFRKIFCCCWKESVKPLQYFCGQLPMSFLVDQHRLLFWQKIFVSNNVILATLSRLISAQFIAVGSFYGITAWTVTPAKIKAAIWNSFTKSLTII